MKVLGEKFHQPVLLDEVLQILNVKQNRDCWFLDATVGDGGHALAILQSGGKVLGIDVDQQSLKRTKDRFKNLKIAPKRYKLFQGNFRNLNQIIQSAKELEGILFKGILFDLGVSSYHLEEGRRGFSFLKEGPLDMRWDTSLNVSAADLIAVLSLRELYELFSKMGEEKFAKRIADAVVCARQVRPITTTKQLKEIVERVYQEVEFKKSKIHPATKVFQALRIIVNDELNAIEEALPQAHSLLKSDGRIAVISFHSLEDRLIKNTFREWEEKGFGQILTKKPITPSDTEIRSNPRSRSGKLRAFVVN